MEQKINIQVLPQELQNQIAAGEVVERPASVVKELVENSLDAGGTNINIEIENGGQNRILVQDNGYGLTTEELSQAVKRHATNKIFSIQDLNMLKSFGFRGEALPSIASVSRFKMISIPFNGTEASEIVIDFGQVIKQGPAALREGTKVEVRDLFLNTPARLKFLKSASTEQKKCQELVYRIALANLQTAFTFRTNKRNLFSFPKKQTLSERLSYIWPPQIMQNLISVNHKKNGYKIQGLTGHPNSAQPRSTRILFYVNNRPVQDKLLLSALRNAYKGKLLSKEYPQSILFLFVPLNEVDVNVHPAKSEIRFRDEKQVFSLIQTAISQALLKAEQNHEAKYFTTSNSNSSSKQSKLQEPRYKFDTFSDFKKNYFQTNEGQVHEYNISFDTNKFNLNASLTYPLSNEEEHSSADYVLLQKEAQFSYLGQFHNSYLLINDQNLSLLLIDQHAAHERILYNRYKKSEEQVVSQALALPLRLTLHPSEQNQLTQIGGYLRKLGFAFDLPNIDLMEIQAIPHHFTSQKAKEFLGLVFSEQANSMDDLWRVMACKNAVKAGDALSFDEAQHLIHTWLSEESNAYCPHGRPTSIRIYPQDLEKYFKRGK